MMSDITLEYYIYRHVQAIPNYRVYRLYDTHSTCICNFLIIMIIKLQCTKYSPARYIFSLLLHLHNSFDPENKIKH